MAIDRATRWVFVKVYASKSAVHAKKFLVALHKKAALGKTIVTDTGSTDRFITTGERTSTGKHLFDRLCSELGIDHRLIQAGRPQTNGILKRFNGRIADIRTTNRFVSGEALALCSAIQPPATTSILGHMHAMKQWYNDRPGLFWKKVRNTQGHDSERTIHALMNTLLLNTRQLAILQLMRSKGRVFVDELAQKYTITPQTVRKDLQRLADVHEVVRFHGGAYVLAGTEYTSYAVRMNIAAAEKIAIGHAVARLIPNNTVLMINAGTTTSYVAKALRRHKGLKIITDNVAIANDLRVVPDMEVIVPGGMVRSSDGAIFGEAAVDFIRQFCADFAVISASAIGRDGSLLDYDLREVHLARAIIENSLHVILAADNSKFEKSAPVKIGHLSQLHTLVTNAQLSLEAKKLCLDCDLEIIEESTDQPDD